MVKRTLIPQFSIRWLLALTTACAFVFSIFALAVQEYLASFRDGYWASGVTIAIVSLAGVLLIHAVAFGAVWAFSEVATSFGRSRSKIGQSPFRADHDSAGRLPDDPEKPMPAIIVE